MSQSVPKLILLSAVICIVPLSFAFAKEADEVETYKTACLKDFTPEQMKDPNSPCYEQVRGQIDERVANGMYYDRNLVVLHKDECDGCHILTNVEVAADTIHNVYHAPFLKSAVPNLSGPTDSSGSDKKSGTD